MKTKVLIIWHIVLLCIGCQINAQNTREFTDYSSCNGTGLKSATSDYRLGYSYRSMDSTLKITGYLGNENCGIEHIFTTKIDSNEVVLSEIIIDTLLATCTCSKKIEIEIDSFCFDQFTVEFNGNFLTDIPSIEENNSFNIYPNPTNGIIRVELTDFTKSTTIDLIDCDGRLIKSIQTRRQNFIEFDLTNFPSGLYMIRIEERYVTRLLIKI